MKNIISFLIIGIFMSLYYMASTLALPFAMVQLFLSVAADDDSNVMTGQRT